MLEAFARRHHADEQKGSDARGFIKSTRGGHLPPRPTPKPVELPRGARKVVTVYAVPNALRGGS